MQRNQLSPQQSRTFLLGGKAIFTLQSEKTGQHLTYKVVQCKNKEDLFFVMAFNGNDNNSHYKYFGYIWNNDVPVFKYGKRAKISEDTISVKAFKWFFRNLIAKNYEYLNNNITFYHEGHCGCCGKKLTTPESVQKGIGPVCEGRMVKS